MQSKGLNTDCISGTLLGAEEKGSEWRCPVLRRSDGRRTSDGHGMGRDHYSGVQGS